MSLDRRGFLATCSRFGFAATLLPGTLYTLAAEAEDKKITADMIDAAATIAGIPVAPDQKAALVTALNANRKFFDEFRELKIPNSVPPAFNFDPLPPGQQPTPPPPGTDRVVVPRASASASQRIGVRYCSRAGRIGATQEGLIACLDRDVPWSSEEI